MVGVVVVPLTVKGTPLLATPPTVTTTFPLVAPAGTEATIAVALQLVGVTVVPLKVTVLVPCVAPKLEPLIVTEVPTGPEVGERLAIAGLPPVLALVAKVMLLSTGVWLGSVVVR